MRRMTFGQKLLADFLGNLPLQCGNNLLLLALSHASHAEIRPHRTLVGPILDQLRQIGVVAR